MTYLLTIEVVREIIRDREREILRRTQLATARRAETPVRRVPRYPRHPIAPGV